ncbi:TIR domain-containing protein [Paenarthrobacter ureafaciens]
MNGPFQRRDIGLMVKALDEDSSITQSYLGTLLASYGLTDLEGNREKRATFLIKSIFDGPNGQENLRELLNEVYWEDSRADSRRGLASSDRLMQRLNELFDLDEDGIPPIASSYSSSATANPLAQSTRIHSVAMQPTGGPAVQQSTVPEPSGTTPHNSRVFVVHGRDDYAHQELNKFLHHLGLRVYSWNQAKLDAPGQQPTTLEIVRTGLNHCQAILVLFTPDDVANVKPEFVKPNDGPHEINPTGQARQNVIFEAGMAIAAAPTKTLFLRYGETREISDISGHNWTSLSNDWSERQLLVEQLKKLELDVDGTKNFGDTNHGDFPPRS